ncbi:hypothetical protein SLS64_003299 [Diaporthe eres]|uniref:SP-RING-type domain-containing protein n=1 Tax=Diaporthe eres TaxID=83184 RepID=A0ABR1PI57_DIAER
MLGSQRRPGRPANHRPRQPRPGQHDSLDLPPYEPPNCPLTDDHKRQLNDFCTGRINDTYEKQIAQSAQLLSQSVYSINERVTSRKKTAAQNAERAAKRKHGGDDAEGDDEAAAAAERAEGEVRELEGEVLNLATQIEEAMRQAVDMQAMVEDEKSTLRELPHLVVARQQGVVEQAQQDREADEEDADPPEVPGVPLLDVLKEAYGAKAAEYDRLSPYEKYAVNNKYIDFRQSWHEGLYQNPDDIPLPDATRWFDRDGRPRLETRKDEQQGGAGEDEDMDGDEDDDIQIAREKRSLRCPLALAVIQDPYTCRLCKHSFEKSAITEYIKGGNGRGRVAECPVPGCHVKTMTLQDLYFDEVLLRRIKRAEQAEREAEARSSDQDEDDDETMVDDEEGHSRVSRASRASTAKRVKAEHRGGDEDEADEDGSA